MSMHQVGGTWLYTALLARGRHQVKFIVDGRWEVSDDLPTLRDERRNINNFIDANPDATQGQPDILVPIFIRWRGGRHVCISGSFNGWSRTVEMQRNGEAFQYVALLPRGRHAFKFIVDGEWRVSENWGTTQDSIGNMNNFVVVTDVEAPRRPPAALVAAAAQPAAARVAAHHPPPGPQAARVAAVVRPAAPPIAAHPPVPPPVAAFVNNGGLRAGAVAWTPTLHLTHPCPVCFDDEHPAGVSMGCGSGEHALCMPCALRSVRGELLPGAIVVRCMPCLSSGATRAINPTAVREIALWSRSARADAVNDLRLMSDDELARFSAIHSRASRGDASRTISTTPDTLERGIPTGLYKLCPNCGTGVQRPRGHHCHHISPGSGCANCGAHWCYACAELYIPGSAPRRCRNNCSLFCSELCDCPDCPDCRPGHPCDDCTGHADGSCWVCRPERRPADRQPTVFETATRERTWLEWFLIPFRRV